MFEKYHDSVTMYYASSNKCCHTYVYSSYDQKMHAGIKCMHSHYISVVDPLKCMYKISHLYLLIKVFK